MDLRSVRTSRGLSQAQLAGKVGLSAKSKGYVSALENGTRKTTIQTALRIYQFDGRFDPKTIVRPEEAHLLAGIAEPSVT